MADNEIAVRESRVLDTWVDVVAPTQTLAEYVARTDFVPKSMRGNAPAVLATMLTGRELGIGPMTALRSLDSIEGGVQMKTKAVLARIFKAGHRVEWFEQTDKACEVRIERKDGLAQAQVRWTMADAQRAGLAGKTNWMKYPRQMLRNRAVSECAEMTCPDVMLGLEVGDDLDGGSTFAPSAPVTVVQSPAVMHVDVPQAAQPMPEPPVAAVEPEPGPEAQPAPQEPAGEPLVTHPQMRKIGALIGELEQIEGRKLDRDERRRLIGFMAGLSEPDDLTSAKDLTKEQASRAIEQLQEAVIADAETVPNPETE